MAKNSTLIKVTCPAYHPKALWDSHNKAMAAPDGKEFKQRWEEHIRLVNTYVKDKNGKCIKNANGNWLIERTVESLNN